MNVSSTCAYFSLSVSPFISISRAQSQDIFSTERDIQIALSVWVDASLPVDFFHITVAQTYCVECLKDEDDSKLTVCTRCSGRLHLECLKHSQGRIRTCRDCVRWSMPIMFAVFMS